MEKSNKKYKVIIIILAIIAVIAVAALIITNVQSKKAAEKQKQQQQADAKPKAEAEEYIDYVGEYLAEDGNTKLDLELDYDAELEVYRLAEFDGRASDPKNGIIAIEAQDPNGAVIKFSFDGKKMLLTVTESSWDNFPKDSTIQFTQKVEIDLDD